MAVAVYVKEYYRKPKARKFSLDLLNAYSENDLNTLLDWVDVLAC